MAAAQAEIITAPQVYKFTREEYHKLADIGLFLDKRVELIDGDVLDRYEDPDPRLHLWSSEEYYQMAEAGLFAGKRVELIGGRIIEMSAVNRPHVRAVKQAAQVFEKAFGDGWFVQSQAPLNLDDLDSYSHPEPDVAVIVGDDDDYVDEHPTTAALVLEVSAATLRFDQNKKASLYAKAGITDFWILNLSARQLEVFRKPVPDAAAPFWFSYSERVIYQETEAVAPLAKPDVLIAVAALLPWPKRN